MQSQFLRACGVLLFLLDVSWIQGQTALLLPVADTSLIESDPMNNLGGLEDVTAGTTENAQGSRALLRFDVSSSVPAGASITAVNLFVTVVKAPLGGGRDSNFALHRLLRDWGEGGKSGSSTGSPASAGEATWVSRFHPATLWAVPGGQEGTDYVASPSAAVFVSGLDLYEFVSSATLIADVQSWVDDPGSNFGWMLKSEDEVSDGTARRFASREDP